MDFHSLHYLAALNRPVSAEPFCSYDAGVKGVWLYYYLKSLVEEFRADRKLWKIIKREIKLIKGSQFGIRDNFVDFSPVLGFTIRLFKNRKDHD